jgi:O-antigen/teichoic acid export membrane protein
VSETALSIAYGRAYAEASLAFTILASTSILSAYASIYGSELQALGRTRPIFLAGAASTTAYVVLLATITKPLGQVGAALARAAMTVVGFSILYRKVDVKLPSNLDKSLVMAVALASTLAPIELFVKADIYLKAFVEASAFVLVALLAFKLVKPLNDHEIGLLKAMIPWRGRASRAQDLMWS